MSKAKYDWDNLIDPQNFHKPEGARVPIQKVGIREYTSPIKFAKKDGSIFDAKATYSVYSDLSEEIKGLNMSRISRSIQDTTLQGVVDITTLCTTVDMLLERLEVQNAYVKMKFDYPMIQTSLRSTNKETGEPNFGWMYYPTEIEIRKSKGHAPRAWISTEFQFSSLCPCSSMMSFDYIDKTSEKAVGHSQRSMAKSTIEIDPKGDFHIEDLVKLHRKAISTEVLGSIVTRADELSFAIRNAQEPKFVEDSVRMLFESLDPVPEILDFCIVASHFESLHPSNVTAVICKGIPNGLR